MKVPRKRLMAGLLAMALAICPIFEWGGGNPSICF